jgi:hypothetical protein
MATIKELVMFGRLSKKYPFSEAALKVMTASGWSSVEMINDLDDLLEDIRGHESSMWRDYCAAGDASYQGWVDYINTCVGRVKEILKMPRPATRKDPVITTETILNIFGDNIKFEKLKGSSRYGWVATSGGYTAYVMFANPYNDDDDPLYPESNLECYVYCNEKQIGSIILPNKSPSLKVEKTIASIINIYRAKSYEVERWAAAKENQ